MAVSRADYWADQRADQMAQTTVVQSDFLWVAQMAAWWAGVRVGLSAGERADC